MECSDDRISPRVARPSAQAAIPLPPPLPPTRTIHGVTKAFSAPLRKTGEAITVNGDQTEMKYREPPAVPCHMFFYGSLMDDDVLQAILDLDEAPTVQKGSITGFAARMWGIYPALVPHPGGMVSGTVWELTSESQFLRLASYETNAYTWCPCSVTLDDGSAVPEAWTFCWAGDVNSKELEEGEFNLERYQKYFKASVTRRRT